MWARAKSALWFLAKLAAAVFLFFTISTILLFAVLIPLTTKPMSKERVERLPVMIFLSGPGGTLDCTFKSLRDVPEFVNGLERYSFLVPKGRERAAADCIESYPQRDPERAGLKPYRLSFRIEQRTDERQLISLSYSYKEGFMSSHYWASEREVYPENFENVFGPGLSLLGAALALPLTWLLWRLGARLLAKLRASK